jgi:hypothetical protein
MKYLTPEKLAQMDHMFDTNASEAFHSKVCTWAPKHTNYAQSWSYNARVWGAVLETNEGIAGAMKLVMQELGLESHYTDDVLGVIEASREARVAHVLLPATKKHRRDKKNAGTIEGRKILAREKAAGMGKYKSCVAMADRVVEREVCRSCGEGGHLTSKARECRNHFDRGAGGGGGPARGGKAPAKKRKAPQENDSSGSDSEDDNIQWAESDSEGEDVGEEAVLEGDSAAAAAVVPPITYQCQECCVERRFPKGMPRPDRRPGGVFTCTYLERLHGLDCTTNEATWNYAVSQLD